MINGHGGNIATCAGRGVRPRGLRHGPRHGVLAAAPGMRCKRLTGFWPGPVIASRPWELYGRSRKGTTPPDVKCSPLHSETEPGRQAAGRCQSLAAGRANSMGPEDFRGAHPDGTHGL